MIMMISPISKQMKLIHNIPIIGSSLTVPGYRVTGVVEMSAQIIPILISDKLIGANMNIDVPFVKDVKLVRYETDFEGLY